MFTTSLWNLFSDWDLRTILKCFERKNVTPKVLKICKPEVILHLFSGEVFRDVRPNVNDIIALVRMLVILIYPCNTLTLSFNPLSPGIKLQILLLCFYTFLTEVVGRSC